MMLGQEFWWDGGPVEIKKFENIEWFSLQGALIVIKFQPLGMDKKEDFSTPIKRNRFPSSTQKVEWLG